MSFQIENQSDILYIAKNIPTPTRKANRVIFTLAEKLRKYHNIDFLYPKEWTPFFAKNMTKYKHLYNLTPWKYSYFNVNIIDYLRLPFPGTALSLTPFFINLPKIGNQYRCIHAHYTIPDGYLAYLFNKQYGTPYGITIRKTDIELIDKTRKNSHTRKTMGKTLKAASFTTCFNSSVQNRIEKHFGITPEIIPHGIEEEFLMEKPPEYDSKINISCAGDFISTKQIDWVIRAFKNLKVDAPISLTIIGDGPDENNLKNRAKGSDNIHFTGRIPKAKVIEHLTRSQIFLLPSNSETYGLVYNEAAARHNAIIGFKNQGPCGTYQEGTEMLFTDNFEDFSQQVNTLVKKPKLRKKLADQALQKAQQLTWEKISERYHSLYTQNS